MHPRFFNPIFYKTTILALALALALALGITATAHAGGVGYVDDRRLIDQSPQGQDILKQLETEFAERSRELKGRFDRLKAQQQDLEKNSVLMTEAELQVKADDLREFQRQLRRDQRDYQDDYARRRGQGLGKLEKTITEVVIAVAKRKKLDLVFQQAVYASPDIDLTDQVLAELKKQYQK